MKTILKIEAKLPEVSLQGTKKQFKKAEKALDNIRHIKQVPKSIKSIRKWQRRIEKDLLFITNYLNENMAMFKAIAKENNSLKERDEKLLTIMFKIVEQLGEVKDDVFYLSGNTFQDRLYNVLRAKMLGDRGTSSFLKDLVGLSKEE